MRAFNFDDMSTTTLATGFLDNVIPLDGASHSDVVEYVVDIPMRYAECFAVLRDGERVSFKMPRGFLGWSSHDEKRSLLFRNGGMRILIQVDPDSCCDEPGHVHDITLESAATDICETEKVVNGTSLLRKFIGVDGKQFVLPN